MKKPDTVTAMLLLICEVRRNIPFSAPESSICIGPCQGCSKKLVEFLDTELCEWQQKLNQGIVPKLGEVEKLGRTAGRIFKVLCRNGIIG